VDKVLKGLQEQMAYKVQQVQLDLKAYKVFKA
jgi:hypothetical protein